MEVYEKDTRKHRPLILKLPSILVWKTGKKKAEGGAQKLFRRPFRHAPGKSNHWYK